MSSSKRNFKIVIGNKEHGLYISSTPSSAARKAVSKLCADNKKKKVEFCIRETTQLSNKKVYGPYIGYMQKLEKPVELKGRVIRYKPIAKLKKKSRKMKGGVEIIGQGVEGIVLTPNINNLNNNGKVSKLITATPEQIAQLIEFENRLNDKDKDGRYHVKMLGFRDITSENINEIPNINQNKKNEMKKYNFKITYQFGGISIKDFLDNFINYQVRVDEYFLQRLLRGILNCFLGLYIFYHHRIVHNDLNNGNIVFFIDNPQVMRLIDWGILLPNDNSNNYSNNNSNTNSANNSSTNSNLQKLIDIKMIDSLSIFYYNIRKLIIRVKLSIGNDKINDIIENFLKILKFESNFDGRILKQEEIDAIRIEMERLILQI